MTIRCECGGEIHIQNMPHGDGGMIHEQYRCQSCGKTGTFKYNTITGEEETSGCVVLA